MVSHFLIVLIVQIAMEWWYVQVHTRIGTATVQSEHHFPTICGASQQRSHCQRSNLKRHVQVTQGPITLIT